MLKVAYKEPEAGIFEGKRWHLQTPNKRFWCEKVPFCTFETLLQRSVLA